MNFKKIYILSWVLCLFFLNNAFSNQTLLSWDTNDENWKPLTRNWFDVSHLIQKKLENWDEYFEDEDWKLYLFNYEIFPKAKLTKDLHYTTAMKLWKLDEKITDFVWMFSEKENDHINWKLYKFEKKFWLNFWIITIFKKEWNTFDQLYNSLKKDNEFDWVLFLVKENNDLYFKSNEKVNSELVNQFIYWEWWFKEQYISNQKFSWIQLFLNNLDETFSKELKLSNNIIETNNLVENNENDNNEKENNTVKLEKKNNYIENNIQETDNNNKWEKILFIPFLLFIVIYLIIMIQLKFKK